MSDPPVDPVTNTRESPGVPQPPPRRRRRLARWIVPPIALAGLLLALVYAPPVHRWAFDRVAARMEQRAGIVVRASRVAIDPFRLRASLDGLSIASAATSSTPFFTAARVDIDAPRAVLGGEVVLDRITIVDPVIDMKKVAPGKPGGKPFRGLGSLRAGRVTIDNLSFFLGGPDNARVAVRKMSLKGSGDAPGRLTLESASPGTLLLEMADARLPFETLTGAFVMDGDRLTISRITATSDTGRAEVSGTARLDTGYPLALDYRASIDLPRSSGWWNRTSTLKGRAALSGHIDGPLKSPTATIRADAAGFAWHTLSPGRLTADGLISESGIRLDTFTLAVPEVTARGKGFLSWREASAQAVPRSTVTATWSTPLLRRLGPLVDLDAGHIPLVSANGIANIEWPGFVPALAGLSGTLQTRIQSGHADGDDRGIIDMTGGDARWSVDWQQWLPGATSALGRLMVRIDPAHFARSVVNGTLEVSAADLAPAIRRAASLDIPVPESALTRLEHGRAELKGTVQGTVAMPQYHATLEADDVALSGLRGIAVGGAFVVDPDGFVTNDLTMRAPGSTVRMNGSIGILKAGSDISFAGTIDATWASAPFARADWPVGGAAAIEGRWIASGDKDDLEISFQSEAAELAGKPLGPVRGLVRSGPVSVTGEIHVPHFGSRFAGVYDLTEARAHTARAEFVKSDVAGWLSLAGVAPETTEGVHLTFDGAADASGMFEGLDSLRLEANLDRLSGDIRGQAVALQAPTVVRWNAGTFDAGAATVTAAGATLSVKPATDSPAASSIAMTAPLSDILALLPPGSVPAGFAADGLVQVEARVAHADPLNPSVRASADIASITQDTRPLANDVHVEARLDGDRVEVPTLVGTVMGAALRASATVPARWIAPWLDRAQDIAPPGRSEARINGTIDAQLATLLKSTGTDAGELDGTARLSIDLGADAPKVEALRGVVTAELLTLTTKGGTFSMDGPGRVRFENGLAVVESLALQGSGARIQATGQIGLTPRGAVDLRFSGTASMSLVDALVEPRVDGSADVELRVVGTFDEPDLEGVLTLRNVSAVSPTARLVLAGVGGHINFRPGLIEVADLEGQLNGGTLAVSGSLPLEPRGIPGDLRLTARDVFLEYPPGLRNRLSADLSLTGGLVSPKVAGTASLLTEPYRESLPRMAQLLAAISPATRAPASEPAGGFSRVALDVAVTSPVPLRLDNSLGRIALLPKVRLVGTVGQPSLVGPVEILDGSAINLQSRLYALTESRMEFAPDDGLIPRLRVRGTTRIGEYTVTLRLTGLADAVEVSLSSEPPLPERDVKALLLTGQVQEGSGRSSGSSDFAVTALSSDLLGVAGQALGFDNVRIGSESFELVSSDVNPAKRLTVSKVFMDRFELVYSDNLDDNTYTWIIVYRPRAGIDLRVSQRDNLDYASEFRHRLTFGPGHSTTAGGAQARTFGRVDVPREIVTAVSIVGEPATTTARLRALLKLTPGKTFEYGQWLRDQDAIRKFFVDGGYLTARIVPTRTLLDAAGSPPTPRVALEYRVTQGPSTAVVVTGFPAEAAFLQRLRMAWASTRFDDFAAEDMSRAARQMLIDAGYVQPVVQTTISETGPGRLLAAVAVHAGPRPTRRSIVFEGMTVFTNLDLLAVATTSGTAAGAWGDPGALCLAIEQAYASAGYRAAKAKAAPVQVAGDAAVLAIRIDEGPATRLGTVTISGVPEDKMAGARAAAGLVPGAPLVLGEERAAAVRLERHFRNLGFGKASVAASVSKAGLDGLVDLSFSVATGPLQVIRSVRVEGAQTTRPSLIARAIRLKPGDPAGQDALADTLRRLYQLGVFSTANIRLTPAQPLDDDAPGEVVPVDAIVTVAEPRRYQLIYGIEFSNAYGPVFENFENAVGVAADVRDGNVFGRGMSMSLGGRYEADHTSARALFSVPTLGSRRIRTNVYWSWLDETENAPDGSTLDSVTQSASVEQRWLPRPWLDVSWGYTISDRRFDLLSVTTMSTAGSDGILASLNGAVIVDRRDNVSDTKRGWFHSSSVQQGAAFIGSDLQYSRYLGRAFVYVPFGRLVSATGARAGWIWNLAGTPVLDAFDLLFNAGGSQTVRGYAQDQLSANEIEGIPVGGTTLLVLNQEFRATLTKRLQGVVFVDAGNTFGREGVVWRDLAVGLGFGIRIHTPLAPLRVDLGFPIPRRPGYPLARWHVSIGHIF